MIINIPKVYVLLMFVHKNDVVWLQSVKMTFAGLPQAPKRHFEKANLRNTWDIQKLLNIIYLTND